MSKFNQLPEVKVCWDKLLLDPNNPRLHSSTQELYDLKGQKGLDLIINKQDYLFNKMQEFETKDLTEPMKEKGFITKGIPQILVKELPNGYYLTLEGNRRVTAVRELMSRVKDNELELNQEVMNSFMEINVINCTELSDEEIEEYLGMIHIGGTKPWLLLPKSKYLFSQFIKELCRIHVRDVPAERFQERFLRDMGNLNDVDGKVAIKNIAKLNTTSQANVKSGISIYRMYIQVNDYLKTTGNEEIDSSKASFLEETNKSPALKKLFGVNNFQFSEEGLIKWVDACCDTIENLEHEEEEKKGAVIKQATAGDSNIRDLAKVFKMDHTLNKERVDEILVDRREARKVLAELETSMIESSLEITLKKVKEYLQKINMDDLENLEISNDAKELFGIVEGQFTRIKRGANIQ